MADALVGLLFVNIDLGVHDVPIELLNVNGAYDKLLDSLSH
jgi:hypothetical protein